MEIGKELEKVLNLQINRELESEYIYLSMQAYFEAGNLKGFGQWMKVQAEEERKHAMKFFEFVNRRGGRVQLAEIPKPKTEWKSALDAFEDALKHERFITDSINQLKAKALSEKDFATDEFLDWFVQEQVEEEENAMEIVAKLRMAGESKQALYMLDKALGERKA